MSNKQQTAVDWLIEQLLDNGFTQIESADIYIEEAKELEKQQIVTAWCNGYDEEDRATSSPLKYYNENYEQ